MDYQCNKCGYTHWTTLGFYPPTDCGLYVPMQLREIVVNQNIYDDLHNVVRTFSNGYYTDVRSEEWRRGTLKEVIKHIIMEELKKSSIPPRISSDRYSNDEIREWIAAARKQLLT